MIFTNISSVVMSGHALIRPPLGDDGQLLVPDHLPHVGGGGLALDLAGGDHLAHLVVGRDDPLLLHAVQSSAACLATISSHTAQIKYLIYKL